MKPLQSGQLITRRTALKTGAALFISALASQARALSEKDNRFITNGGCRLDGSIRKVTSLADNGPGTLREALTGIDGATVVVFEVGGEIALGEDIHIRGSNVTVAGQTAPDPGITITGASLRIRANDVAIEHIAIRPGMAAMPAERADGLTIGGGARPVKRVRVRNISASWSKDELLSLARPTSGPVSITHSIFAEALKFAGHPKGDHSMAMLVRDAPDGVVIAGNLFISNVHRNPVLASNTKAEVRNNWIVNPRYNAVHMYLDTDADKLTVDVRNNVMTPGQDTEATRVVSMPPADEIRTKGSRISNVDNKVVTREILLREGLENWTPGQSATAELATMDVPAHVLHYAGMRPSSRNAVDQRILDDALAGRAAVVDQPPETTPLEEPTVRTFQGPERPFEQEPFGNTAIELWLERLHLEMGGAPGIKLG